MKTKYILIGLALFIAATIHAQTKPVVLPLLTSPNGAPLLTNAQFSSQIGSKITFRDEAGAVKAFGVTQLSDASLLALNISAEKALAEQAEIDRKRNAYQQVVAAKSAEYKVKSEQAKAEWDQKKADKKTALKKGKTEWEKKEAKMLGTAPAKPVTIRIEDPNDHGRIGAYRRY